MVSCINKAIISVILPWVWYLIGWIMQKSREFIFNDLGGCIENKTVGLCKGLFDTDG